jgi:hypothetical protein
MECDNGLLGADIRLETSRSGLKASDSSLLRIDGCKMRYNRATMADDRKRMQISIKKIALTLDLI